jgi:hypothetical protein
MFGDDQEKVSTASLFPLFSSSLISYVVIMIVVVVIDGEESGGGVSFATATSAARLFRLHHRTSTVHFSPQHTHTPFVFLPPTTPPPG